MTTLDELNTNIKTLNELLNTEISDEKEQDKLNTIRRQFTDIQKSVRSYNETIMRAMLRYMSLNEAHSATIGQAKKSMADARSWELQAVKITADNNVNLAKANLKEARRALQEHEDQEQLSTAT